MAERSYHEFCGLARALDLIGDRWTLLVVRELLIEPRRFGELQEGLPGIASNLLAERLRRLEDHGIITRQLGNPGAGIRYALTEWGEALREPIDGLIRWSTPLMVPGQGTDHFDPRWLVLSLTALLRDHHADPPITTTVTVGGQAITICIGPTGPQVTLSPSDGERPQLAAEMVLALAADLDPDLLAEHPAHLEPGQLASLVSVLTAV